MLLSGLAVVGWATSAAAVISAEVYTNEAYQYGRFSASVQFAPGSGVVSSFFLWKDGSEVAGTFWNELDFEKLEEECRVETNAIYGEPEEIAPERATLSGDLCAEYHTYTYEWTPEYIAWSVDGVELRRETSEVATAFMENAQTGMQLRFNVWPGDATFGGEFDAAILPVYQYIDWVEYSSYENGSFELQWREDFEQNTLPAGWSLGSWDSPKGLSTHQSSNFGIVDGVAILALTPDDAPGIDGVVPPPGTPPAAVNPEPGGNTPSPTPAATSTAEPAAPSPSGAMPPGTIGEPPVAAPEAGSDEPEGCACRVGPSPATRTFPWALAMGGVVAYRLRRWRPRRSSRSRA